MKKTDEEKVKKVVKKAKKTKNKKTKPRKKKVLKKAKPKKAIKKPSKKKKKAWWKWAIGIVAIVIIAFFAVQAYLAFDAIWGENRTGQSPFLKLFGNVEAGQLKGEGDGRINILCLGVPGGNHGGRDLSDTNIILSIDPINKKAAMLSLPRDMWVDMEGYGASKLNAIHAYGLVNGDDDAGPEAAKQVISKIVDLPIHYYVRVDFLGLIKMINAINGISIKVKNDIYDPYFPDRYMAGYEVYQIEAGNHHLTGDEALKYARSRYTTSDFDRAYRQQQVIMAVKKKLARKNVFLNPERLLSLLSIAKHHLKTDMQPGEIKRLAEIADQISTQEIVSKVLDNSPEGLLVSDQINGSSVLLPRSGDWTEIQGLAHRIFTEPFLEQENAKIEMQNGTNEVGLATEAAHILRDFGYNIRKVKDAKKHNYKQTLIIDYFIGQKPHTLDLLSKRMLNAKVMHDGLSENGLDIVIVLGNDFEIADLYR